MSFGHESPIRSTEIHWDMNSNHAVLKFVIWELEGNNFIYKQTYMKSQKDDHTCRWYYYNYVTHLWNIIG